jgi:hypothetical protein
VNIGPANIDYSLSWIMIFTFLKNFITIPDFNQHIKRNTHDLLIFSLFYLIRSISEIISMINLAKFEE